MLKSREELDLLLAEFIKKKKFEQYSDNIIDYVYTRHNIPKGELADYLSGRKDWTDANDVLIFCVFEALKHLEIKFDQRMASYYDKYMEFYTKSEVGKYSKYKQKSDLIQWPLRISCCQVANDQWIGTTDMKTLLQLGEAQLIRYNENAQRIMRKKVSGGQEEYIPYVNKRAVNEIVAFYKTGIYIPNTLTLNIPEDVEVAFKYDEEAHEIIFSSIQCLDITDGYHRYLAAIKVHNDNPDFNTPIELRITQFSDEKARGFIYQEDQKTKMTVVESNSMRVNAPANIIVDRLNTSSSSNFKGLILRNGGIINQPLLVSCLDKHFISSRSDMPRAEIIKQYKIVEDFFNTISEADTGLLSKPWTFEYTLSAVMVMVYVDTNKKVKINLNKIIQALTKEIKITPSQKLNKEDKKAIEATIENLIKSK